MRLRYEYLRCRDTGHQWDLDHFSSVRKPFFGTRRVLRCDSCGANRIEIIDSLGQVAARSYAYADDYDSVTSLSKAEARAEVVAHIKRAAR